MEVSTSCYHGGAIITHRGIEVKVTSSNTTVHNLTYKDYMERNSLTEDQKKVLEELMSADTSNLCGLGAIGAQVAQMAMTKLGCGYSQDKRMQEGWYDCSPETLSFIRMKITGGSAIFPMWQSM